MTQTLVPVLKVSEHFHSIQGEGRWTGTPMHFIRLAGCNVGKQPQVDPNDPIQIVGPLLKTGARAAECCTYDGRPFWCDTDFFSSTAISVDDLAKETHETHIVFTGGEPLLHWRAIQDFIERHPRFMYHVETSGTIELEAIPVGLWLTCAPKRGFIPAFVDHCDEIKLLVDSAFDLDTVPRVVLGHPRVYVQPVNDELRINLVNLQLCLDILKKRPAWHLSVQLHKVFNWR